MTVARADPSLVRTVGDTALTFAGIGAWALGELRRQPGRVVAELSASLRAAAVGAAVGAVRGAVRGAVTLVLDQLDLTELVIERIDLDRVVEELDIEAIVRRLDVTGIARQVLVDIDLPEIIRESGGLMVSESVRDARMRGIAADRLVATWVRRVLRPGRPDATPAGGPDAAVPDDG